MTIAAAGPIAARESATARSPADVEAAVTPSVLTRVPRPGPSSTVVTLAALAGGLEAVQAEWGADGGHVVLTGRRPFLDVTGRAGFRPDGTLDGTVQMRARLAVLGLTLGEATWSVAGWDPGAALATPGVTLQGSTLALDLAQLPAETSLTTDPSVVSTRDGAAATVELPTEAFEGGEPLSPRYAEIFGGLLGVDLSGMDVHADAPLNDAPAFVTNEDLFFAPGMYGADSPQTLELLDAALRAALAGLFGPVGGAAPAPAPQAPLQGAATATPEPSTDVVEANPAGDAAVAEVASPEGADAGAAAAAAAAAGGAAGEGTPGEEAVPEGEEGAVDEAPPVEVIMPEAPTEPTPAAAARGGAVAGGGGGAAAAARDMPTADDSTTAARGAVVEPASETAARAQEAVAAELGERPPPSPEIVALTVRIRDAIAANRPEDEDQLLATDPTREAQAAGATITGSVEAQSDEVSASYDAMASPPSGSPTLSPNPVTPESPAVAGMGVDAASAAPDPIPPENTNLDADVAATDQRISDSGIETRVTDEIPDGPFQATRDARGELGELAQRTPEEIHAEEQVAIDSAQSDMANLQLQAMATLRASRERAVGGVDGATGEMTGQEEVTRDNVSQLAQGVYDRAQTQVQELLTPLSSTAMARWDAGLARLSREFHDALNEVQRWIDERHSGVLGTIVAIGDYITGLPGWVIRAYDRAERAFGDGVCELLLEISSDVNTVIIAAQGVIQGARDEINGMFDQMEAEFPEFVAAERARFAGMLDSLDTQVTDAQTSFVEDVSARAIDAVNEAHAAVQAKRDEAGGLIGRVVAAIEEFIDDPIKAIINGLLRLVGIPPGAFWSLIAQIEQVASDIAEDPENFINNLVAGVKQGFQQFYDNFGTHLLGAFWQWLFSGLKTPIPMPSSFDPISLVTFALQLMGITWPNIREILVRHLGPEAVELLEIAWQILSVLINEGPQGLVNMIKEQLSPENIVGMILDAAIEYIIEKLIVKAAEYVFSLLNPAGAVAQAIMLIYRVCSWIFRNAARIFAFVQAVVGGMADVIAGNIGGLAATVERALASMLVVVIDLFAGLLGLGDLPDEVAGVITRMQTYILGIIDSIIGWIVTQARALLARIGIGGDEDDDDEDGDDNDDEELGKTVRFSGGNESHRLWVDRSGDTATVMVASTSGPVEAKVAEWDGMLVANDPREPLVAQIQGAVAAIGNNANSLAAAFEAALRDPSDENKVPSDSPLEAAEDSLAGLLRQGFEEFGQQDEATILGWIMKVLPSAASNLVSGADATLANDLREAKYVPLGQSVESPMWTAGAGAAEALTAAEAAGSNRTNHLRLVPWFREGNKTEADASTAAFTDHATTGPGKNGFGEPVRKAFGDAYVTALKSTPLANIDPIDTRSPSQIGAMTWHEGAGGAGTIHHAPDELKDTDPPLITAVGGALLPFMKAIARGAPAHEYGLPRLTWAFTHRPSKKFVKDAFRGLNPGTHEWIPTGDLILVMQRAVDAAPNPGGFHTGVQWINVYHYLRTDTTRVYYRIVNVPTRQTISDVLYQVGVGFHSGVAYRGEDGKEGQRGVGLFDQGEFHDRLRAAFAGYSLNDPAGYVQALRGMLPNLLWDGNLGAYGLPPATYTAPLSFWFRDTGGGARFTGATLQDLAAAQQAHRAAINADFDNALAHINDP